MPRNLWDKWQRHGDEHSPPATLLLKFVCKRSLWTRNGTESFRNSWNYFSPRLKHFKNSWQWFELARWAELLLFHCTGADKQKPSVSEGWFQLGIHGNTASQGHLRKHHGSINQQGRTGALLTSSWSLEEPWGFNPERFYGTRVLADAWILVPGYSLWKMLEGNKGCPSKGTTKIHCQWHTELSWHGITEIHIFLTMAKEEWSEGAEIRLRTTIANFRQKELFLFAVFPNHCLGISNSLQA